MQTPTSNPIQAGHTMMDWLKAVHPLRMAPNSAGSNQANAILRQVLPFTVHEYEAGREFNGWTVPMEWNPIQAEIRKDGVLIYDAMQSPLGVCGYAPSFTGRVPLDELKAHLFYHPVFPDAQVYHCDYYYKPWRRDWGFSVPQTLFDSLTEGEYEVTLVTEEKPNPMKVLEYVLPGESDETIVLNAHNCHTGQANDDVSGIVVGMEVIKRLQQQEKRYYSYRLIVAPEHFGTIFYLADLPESARRTLKYAMFLESLGNDNRLALQASFTGESVLDHAARHYLRYHQPEFQDAAFRRVVGNDETVWEAPGYEIPCISLSRMPFPEYHSSRDTAEIILESRLEEAVEAVLGMVQILETNVRMTRHFTGLLALSNPKYDLYIPTFDPSLRVDVSDAQKRWNNLMDCVIRYFDERHTVLDIALKHDVEYGQLWAYLNKFQQKGLISFVGTPV